MSKTKFFEVAKQATFWIGGADLKKVLIQKLDYFPKYFFTKSMKGVFALKTDNIKLKMLFEVTFLPKYGV